MHQRLRQRHANLPYHQACFSTSINPQEIQVCFQEHGIERATEVDDQQMTVLHMLRYIHMLILMLLAIIERATEVADQK